MNGAPPTASTLLAQLTRRLADTVPVHAREEWRLGSARAIDVLPDLNQLLPAAPVPAAVLVGLVDHAHDPALLLTVRNSRLRHHGGQISFPGGRLEAGDASPSAAALREAEEEVGLAASQVEVIGYLPDHLVLTGYRVTPVVARISPTCALRPDESEVDDVFELPWSVLADDACVQRGERTFGGVTVPVRDILFGAHRIWGLTAGILLLLRDLVREPA
jgi:8-oxo-dGTP pyrophosphatase MutT (NUDIX family)